MLPHRNIFVFLIVLVSCQLFSQEKLSQYVNPFIGTGGTGHTFPGAVLPFGMVQLSPDTRVDGSWEGCSGYAYPDNTIYGFSHTHLSGTGCSDWGDVMLMPMSSNPSLDKKVYSSKFSHSTEKASAGFYEVMLDDEKIKVELTVTPRTGIHKYTFPKNTEQNLVLDLLHRDKLLAGNINILDSVTLTGIRVSEAWAKKQYCYFAITFSRPFKTAELYAAGKLLEKESTVASEGCILKFGQSDKPLLVKVAISPVDKSGAVNNLKTEAKHWDFEQYKKNAEDTWNKQLQKIVVKSNDKDKLTVFYTALYHACIHPSLSMDCDNRYRGRDNGIHTATNYTNYTVFSLWDTYRAVHPLFTIIEPKRNSDFIKTFLNQYQLSGRLPVWELSSYETDCMIGYHSVSVIADAMAKGITDFDKKLVYESVLAASNYTGFGIRECTKKGYLSADDEAESVSRTLEYSYDNWCISRIMEFLGKPEESKLYYRRSNGWRNVYDPASTFMRPRKNGDWLSPFDPKEVNNHFTEGNSWQYSFYVPYDIKGLTVAYGGDKKFEAKLDTLFGTTTKTTGRTQNDITGLIGQYAHGNEPSHHMSYLYNYIGKPYKTQEKVSYIMKEFYKNATDGLIGNEDCGQMSAWYVFSAMGFYPVCPGNPQYVIGKPVFDSIFIHLDNGNSFVVTANDSKLTYVKSLSMNGSSRLHSYLLHSDILNGGNLQFTLKEKPDSLNIFGKSAMNRPQLKTNIELFLPAPFVNAPSKSFFGSQQISLSYPGKRFQQVYTTDGTEPTRNSKVYKGPFKIDTTCIVKTKLYAEKDSSATTEAKFVERPNDWKIAIKSKYNKQYTAGGDEGIIDGIYGDENWRKGEWQGYQYQDFEAVIDLGQVKEITSFTLSCLQDTRSWIIFPKKVTVMVSNDNKSFVPFATIANTISAQDYEVQVRKLLYNTTTPKKGRYVKVVAENFGKLPEWHEGKGDGAFIFIDEIEIK